MNLVILVLAGSIILSIFVKRRQEREKKIKLAATELLRKKVLEQVKQGAVQSNLMNWLVSSTDTFFVGQRMTMAPDGTFGGTTEMFIPEFKGNTQVPAETVRSILAEAEPIIQKNASRLVSQRFDVLIKMGETFPNLIDDVIIDGSKGDENDQFTGEVNINVAGLNGSMLIPAGTINTIVAAAKVKIETEALEELWDRTINPMIDSGGKLQDIARKMEELGADAALVTSPNEFSSAVTGQITFEVSCFNNPIRLSFPASGNDFLKSIQDKFVQLDKGINQGVICVCHFDQFIESKREMMSESYPHQNKNGAPDKRKNPEDNKLTRRTNTNRACGRCGNEWEAEITETGIHHYKTDFSFKVESKSSRRVDKVAGSFKAPIYAIAQVLSAPMRDLASVVNALNDQPRKLISLLQAAADQKATHRWK